MAQGIEPRVVSGAFLTSSPKIDGVIGAAEWQGASVLEGFVDSDDGGAPVVPVKAWLAAGKEGVYWAVRVETHPKRVRAD
ncbi:MAG: hypothetical protein MH204_00530, partial [Fimbriimonadaceae bacterium]|nr:hypothetical protein [Fimbriimonadaceae bacterium]